MWNSIPDPTEALRALAGSRLHTLEVYRGGIALGFDAGYLRLSALPTVYVDTQVFGPEVTGYFSKLHGLVADLAVAAALTPDMTLAISFTSGARLCVPVRDGAGVLTRVDRSRLVLFGEASAIDGQPAHESRIDARDEDPRFPVYLRLIDRDLDHVAFTLDYLTLSFRPWYVTLLVWPTILIGSTATTMESDGYFDRLCGLIGKSLRDAVDDDPNDELRLFIADSELLFDFKEAPGDRVIIGGPNNQLFS